VNLTLDQGRLVGTLPIADRQRVEIAKALSSNPRVVIMDEPTAMLTGAEIGNLFKLIGELNRRGIAIVYISHRLDEVAHLADRVTVLRDGRVVQTLPAAAASPQRLVQLMVGREIDNLYPKPKVQIGEVLLRAEGICRRGKAVDLVDCTVEVRAGEIVGVAGVAGNGQDELFAAISGERLSADSGAVVIEHALRIAGIPHDAELVTRVMNEVKQLREERAESSDFADFHSRYYEHLNRLGVTDEEVVEIAAALMESPTT